MLSLDIASCYPTSDIFYKELKKPVSISASQHFRFFLAKRKHEKLIGFILKHFRRGGS